MTKKKIISSIIITVDLIYREKELINRILNQLENFKKINSNIILVHNNRNGYFDNLLQKKIYNLSNKKLIFISDLFYLGKINNSILRNVAIKKNEKKFSILIDADIYPDNKLIEYIIRKLLKKKLVIIPCLYLNNLATIKILKNKKKKKFFINDYFNLERNYIMNIACPSSVCGFVTHDARNIKGFFEEYSGHGYEDLDFLVRLSQKNKIFNKKNLNLENNNFAPLLADGLKASLIKISFEELKNKLFAFHLFHKKNIAYKLERKKNKILFKKRILNYNANNSFNNNLLIEFIKFLSSNNLFIKSYLAYLDNRPWFKIKKNIFKSIVNYVKN